MLELQADPRFGGSAALGRRIAIEEAVQHAVVKRPSTIARVED